jgi:hypothetical protein
VYEGVSEIIESRSAREESQRASELREFALHGGSSSTTLVSVSTDRHSLDDRSSQQQRRQRRAIWSLDFNEQLEAAP